ncbi:hypothetical protein L2E82_14956 [Cichorium intybus]|uniref:Uncharacterized protein n=1 Tax=Cichorium intybus TaxID=13427 RepID=A0ACB9F135_CICIN|nr:hypothetical protein L2E82_14956 [Cichorium intybus]
MNYSSDEDDKPLVFKRSSNSDRFKHANQQKPAVPKPVVRPAAKQKSESDDSEDDKPLSSRISTVPIKPNSNHVKIIPTTRPQVKHEDSNHKKPLPSKIPSKPSVGPSVKKHDDSDDDDDDDKPLSLRVNQNVKPESESDDDDDHVPISQRIKNQPPSSSKSSSVKKVMKVNSSSSTFKKSKKVEKKSKYSKPSKVPPGSGEGQKWTSLVHNGVIFPPPYKPHGVKILYKGKPVDLTPEQEEVRTSSILEAITRILVLLSPPKDLKTHSPASLLRRIHRPTSRTFRPPLVSQHPLQPTTVGFSNSQPTHREPSTSRRVHRHPAPSHQQTSAAATVYAFYGEHHNKPDATTIIAGSHRTSHQPPQLRPGLPTRRTLLRGFEFWLHIGLEWKGTESKMLNNTSMYLQVLSVVKVYLRCCYYLSNGQWGQKSMVEKLAYSSEIQEMRLLFVAFSLLEYEKELKPKYRFPVSLSPPHRYVLDF